MRLDAGEEWDGSLQIPPTHRSSLWKIVLCILETLVIKGEWCEASQLKPEEQQAICLNNLQRGSTGPAPGQSQKSKVGNSTMQEVKWEIAGQWLLRKGGRDGCLLWLVWVGLLREHETRVASGKRFTISLLRTLHCPLQGKLTSSTSKEYVWYRGRHSPDLVPNCVGA